MPASRFSSPAFHHVSDSSRHQWMPSHSGLIVRLPAAQAPSRSALWRERRHAHTTPRARILRWLSSASLSALEDIAYHAHALPPRMPSILPAIPFRIAGRPARHDESQLSPKYAHQAPVLRRVLPANDCSATSHANRWMTSVASPVHNAWNSFAYSRSFRPTPSYIRGR